MSRLTLRDDWILNTVDPPPKPDNAHYTRGIPLKVLHILSGRFQQIVGHNPTLVVLKPAVLSHLLHPDSMVHQFPLHTPPLALLGRRRVHVDQVRLASAQLGKDDHARAGRVDARALLEELRGRPRVVDPDGGAAANPYGDQRGVVVLGELFKPEPGLVVREHERVAHDGEWKRARGLCKVRHDGYRVSLGLCLFLTIFDRSHSILA